MNKYKVEITQKHYYIVDVLEENETDARKSAYAKWNEAVKTGTEHYLEDHDPEMEIETIYDVTNTDDPFNP